MSDADITLIVLGVAIVAFISNRFPVEIVAIAVSVALYATGVVTARDVFAGFGDPVIAFIAALFVVSASLEASGVTAWLSGVLSRLAGDSRMRAGLALLLLAAVLSALITINGAAAALLPVVVATALRLGVAPSRMLIPFAFACSAGSLLTLSGSPVNVIVDEAFRTEGGGGFGYFEYAAIGAPLVVVTVVIVLALGPRLLPSRGDAPGSQGRSAPAHRHRMTGSRGYRLEISPSSDLVDRRAREVVTEPLQLVGVQDRAHVAVSDNHRLRVGDSLVVTGPDDAARTLGAQTQTVVRALDAAGPDELARRDEGLLEAVVPPRSDWVGRRVFPGMTVTDGVEVVSVSRRGSDRGARSTDLVQGDAVLLHGGWDALSAFGDMQLLLVDDPEELRGTPTSLAPTAPRAIFIVVAMIVVLATGLVPASVTALVAAAATVLLRVLTPERAMRAMPIQTIILIGALIPLSLAVQSTGAADKIAGPVVDLVQGRSPYLVLLVLFVLTAALGQFISNAATVLIVIPIALATAAEVHMSIAPVLMTVTVAGAASLLTPIATPANLIIMAPGGLSLRRLLAAGWGGDAGLARGIAGTDPAHLAGVRDGAPQSNTDRTPVAVPSGTATGVRC
ncbi:SLC13 family permease [Gordonia jinhuaensis]|uniref:SLC13 family permease n=2 Tax=Gordonia jinhuaensis TaxID=1517702 RepID=A0A916SWL2_9ACTN|nr:SLC13 family permease [Gordonia jinhuaensis]